MVDSLRIHAADERGPRRNGEFVLYWMQGVTMRSRANFALNFAIEQANQLGLPVLVYQGLRHDYPWASDRFHTFILESARDLYRGFGERGLGGEGGRGRGCSDRRGDRQRRPLQKRWPGGGASGEGRVDEREWLGNADAFGAGDHEIEGAGLVENQHGQCVAQGG